MIELKIDPEFRDKIPPLTEAEFEQLRENILADREVYEPLVVWNGTIVDGHNRYKIVQEHPEIPFKVREEHFSDKWSAFEWMYRKQLGRRNLTGEQKTYMIGKMYEARKKSVGGQEGNVNAKNEVDKMSESFKSKREVKDGTAGEIGKEFGVDGRTVRRAEQFSSGVDALREVSKEAADKVMSGNSGATKTKISEVANMTADEKKQFAEDVVSGEIKKHRGWTKADRESRALTERIVAEMKDTEHLPVFTIDALVECLEIDADNYVSALRNRLMDMSELLTPENKPVIAKLIEEKVIQKIQKVKELVAT